MEENSTLSIATIQKRVGAFVIDDMVIALLLLVIFFQPLSNIATHLPEVLTPEAIEQFKIELHQFSVNYLPFIVLLKVVYHTFFVWQNGKTLGKYFMKIKVVNENTQETPTLSFALLRASLRILSEVFFYLGFVFALFLPLKQTMHDKISKNVVIND